MGDQKILAEKGMAAVDRLTVAEPDAEVRCQIASTARRLSARQALPLVAALLRRDVDSRDPFIPLVCWWTIESFCDSERAEVLASSGLQGAANLTGCPTRSGTPRWRDNTSSHV